jgi:predicted DCC family thiol-disulfide oxidoreductase YuxK
MMNSAPAIPVILYDADCNLCTGSVRFIQRHTASETFTCFPLNSLEALSLLTEGPPPGDTIILLDASGRHERSTAALRIAARMKRPWAWLRFLRIVPEPWRDRLYDWVARNRIRFFGRPSA